MKRADDADNPPPLTNAERARAQLAGREALRHQEEIEAREKRERDDAQVEFYRGIFKGEIDVTKAFAADAEGDEADDKDESTPAAEPAGHVISPAKKHRPITFDTTDGVRMKFSNERALAEWIAIQHRVRKSTTTPEDHHHMSNTLDLSAIVKSYGLQALTKHMQAEGTSFGVSESELTSLATEHAQRLYPNDRPDVSFAKLYSEDQSLRSAIELAKNAAFTADAEAEADAAAACKELQAIGKARWGSLSP